MQKQVKNNTDELFAQFAQYEIPTEQAALVIGGANCRITGYRVHDGRVYWDYAVISSPDQEEVCEGFSEPYISGEDLDSMIGTTFNC